MKTYRLVCNPYTVTNTLSLKTDKGLKRINADSALAIIEHDRMQRWLDPHDSWKGFFATLRKVSGDSELKIEFVGTKQDLDDLVLACRAYTPGLGMKVEIVSELTAAQQAQIAGDYKLIEVDTLLKEAKKNSALVSPELSTYFARALDPFFEINVVAPVSCGKSTLQNALIGRKLLPTALLAKTAVITRTTINNTMSDYTVKSRLHNGKIERYDVPVTQELIEKLNDEMDSSDPEGKSALRDEILLEGPSEQFKDTALQLVFIDTPGGNNAMNERHKAVMTKALRNENKSMILFVFDEKGIQVESTKEILGAAAKAMADGLNGKMSEDRMLFVCTGCDRATDTLDDTEEAIRDVLSKQGISNPNLFMVSARAMEAIRMQEYNQECKKNGREDLVEPLTDKELRDYRSDIEQLAYCDLYRYSSIPEIKLKEYEEQIRSLRSERDEYEEKISEIDHNEGLTRREKAAEKADYEDAIDEINHQIAYINSGIPALEYTIREYLNRYAIPMKIQQLHENVSRKATEQAMLKKATDAWAASDNSRKAAEKEAERLLKKYESNATLQSDRNKLSKIRLDQVQITKRNAEVQKRLDNMSVNVYSGKYMTIGGRSGYWLSVDEAERYVEAINDQIRYEIEKMCLEMNAYFNDTIVKNCKKIMDDYRAHVKSLQEEGMFNLAGLDLREMTGYANYCAPDIVFSEISETQREIIGYRTVKLPGLMNKFRRRFNRGGTKQEAIYENRTYIMADDIRKNQIAESRHEYDSWFNGRVDEVKDNIDALKEQVGERMDSLDNYMREIFKSYGEKLKDSEKLRKEAEQRKKESDWVSGFLEKVDRLTNIEKIKEL